MPYDIIIGRDKSDKEKFKDRGLIYIGKGYVKMGNYNSLSNKIWLDVARSHVILISGKRGSGKSYSLAVITEEISNLPEEIKQNIAPLIFDTMGIFWTMKFRNEKELDLLEAWDLKPKNLPVNVFVPFGYFEEYEKRGISVDKKFALSPFELDVEDWISIFKLDMVSSLSVLIQKIILDLKSKGEFDIEDIISEIYNYKNAEQKIKNSAISLFEAAKSWKIFSKSYETKTKINDLLSPGLTTVLDLSMYSSASVFNVKALIIGLISKKIFNQRVISRKREEILEIANQNIQSKDLEKKETPLIWLFIDEAHEFLPKNKITPATSSLIQILREGRQPGISLVLATQQPGVIHRDVMTQSDIIISHRLTNKKDIEALNEIMQTYLLDSIQKSMNNLPNLKGSAIILDDNSERLFPVRIKPRFTWHGGEAPKAVREGKNDFF
jgi:DNA helicase HerA-like ATPase